ncbi:MAG: serine hydrolase domain-containing protein [Phycisphaerales bacterium]
MPDQMVDQMPEQMPQVRRATPVFRRSGRRATLRLASLAAAGVLLASTGPVSADAATRTASQDAAVAVDPGAADAAAITDLDARLAEIVDRLTEAMKETHVPGAGLAIVVDGRPVLTTGLGVRNLTDGDSVDADTVFAIGSHTKSMTGLIAASLAHEGQLPLATRVADRLPEFRFHDEAANEQATMEDLLCHRSGVMRTDLLWYGGYADWDDIREAFARAEPVDDFRTGFNYQNVCFLAAGQMIQEVTRVAWADQLQTRVLRPLKLTDTGVATDMLRESAGNRHPATGYKRHRIDPWHPRDADEQPILPWMDPDEIVLDSSDAEGWWQRTTIRDLAAIAPAGAVNSTATDMAEWIACLVRGGVAEDGTRVFAAEALDDMWTERNSMGPGMGYGLGWMIRESRGRRMVEHGGNIDGFSAAAGLLPDDGIGWAIMANLDGTPFVSQATEIILAGLLDPRSTSEDGGDAGADGPAETNLDRFAGTYDAVSAFGKPVEVFVRDGALRVDVPGQIVFTLAAPDPDTGRRAFEGFPQIEVSFVEDDEGPLSMVLHQGGMNLEWLREGRMYPLDMPLEEMAPYLGRYSPDGADVVFEVRIVDNRLTVEIPGQPALALGAPNDDGRWSLRATDRVTVEFVRADAADADADAAAGNVAGEANVVALVINEPGEQVRADRVVVAGGALPTMEDLILIVQASQGREEWEKRIGLRMRGPFSADNQGFGGVATLDLAGYDRMRDRMDLGVHGWIESGMFADRVWADTSFGTFEVMDRSIIPGVLMASPVLHMADWEALYASFAVIDRVDRDGGARYVVQARLEDGSSRTIEIGVDDGLVYEVAGTVVVPRLGSLAQTVTFERYESHGGVMLPMRIVTQNAVLGRVVREFETVEWDPEFGGDIFRKHDPAG